MSNEPSPLRRACEAVIIANPGVTMIGISRLVGEGVDSIRHLVKGLAKGGAVLSCQLDGQSATRSYYHKTHAHLVPQLDIFECCKRNWQGYHIHKVFGRKGKVKLNGDLVAV